MFLRLVLAVLGFIAFVNGYPGIFRIGTSLSAHPAPIYIDKGGNVGVDFLGYRASAGLGGLLTGDATQGGLHAEAGTPHGQQAAAGLGGTVDSEGKAKGGLYAGATAGGGISASAGLAGGASGEAGGAVASVGGVKVKSAEKAVVVEEKKVQGPPEIQRTVVQRTIIPNYIEKKVQETQYVEKTIRVPQVVEKTVRVPVAPTVIEKTVDVPAKTVAVDTYPIGKTATFQAGVKVGAPKIAYVPPTYVTGTKYIGAGGYLSGGGASIGTGTHPSAGTTYTIRKTATPQLFTDIFNIPISTLGAVRNLLTGIAGGVSGSVAVDKQVGIKTY